MTARDIDSRSVLDAPTLRLLFAVAIGWLDRKGREVFRYVIEENRRQLAGQRLQLRNGVKLPDPVRIARAFAPRIPRGF